MVGECCTLLGRKWMNILWAVGQLEDELKAQSYMKYKIQKACWHHTLEYAHILHWPLFTWLDGLQTVFFLCQTAITLNNRNVHPFYFLWHVMEKEGVRKSSVATLRREKRLSCSYIIIRGHCVSIKLGCIHLIFVLEMWVKVWKPSCSITSSAGSPLSLSSNPTDKGITGISPN